MLDTKPIKQKLFLMTQDTNDRRARVRAWGQAALDCYAVDYLSDLKSDLSGLARVETTDPSTAETLWQLPEADTPIVEAAIHRARSAQPSWERISAAEKSALMLACAEALAPHADSIAECLALETGKALVTECRAEVDLMLSIFRYFAGLGHEIKGRSIQAGHSLLGFTTHHPWGVVAGIVPWNVPLMFMAYKTATPLMAGNTVVIKMPEEASATLAFCFALIRQVLPENVVHFLSGTGQGCGAALVSNPGIDKVSFTGSVETGREVMGMAARDLRPVTLELGGKSPMVILQDCDHEKAINGIYGSMRFTRSGQSCTASSRIYVPSHQLEQYREALKSRLNSLEIGDALDEATECGPVVTRRQKSRIEGFVASAREDGLTVDRLGTRSASGNGPGWYVDPHVIISPDIGHKVSQEEIFGPVATLTGYKTIEEVTSFANATPFGLSASVWGRDISVCLGLARDFRAGIVQINQNAVMLPGFSYGGVGISGQGKESSLEAMLETYMYEKTNIVTFE